MPSELSADHGDQSVEELRRELAEAREQQAATAEILRVISSSPTDLQHVFAVVAANAVRLCDANDAQIRQVDGSTLRLVAQHGSIPSNPVVTATRGLASGRAVLECRTVQIADMHAVADEYPEGSDIARRLGYRTFLAVPLIRAGNAIGVINVRRAECRPFSDRQIDLLKTFADQAVIAIENTRLFEEVQARNTELRVALEQQTATSELLKVIGRSTFDLQPVFETLAQNAVMLCEAEHAFIFLYDGQFLRSVASHNIPPALRAFVDANPTRPGRESAAGRAASERRTVHIEDIRADPEFTYGVVHVGPMRTVLAIPMVRADKLLGVIVITRPEVRLFTHSQIALMETFADQAVIAIENTRLFEEVQARTGELTQRTQELTETLEYQTATSKVLRVIGSSPGNLAPVFDAMLTNAVRICEAKFGVLFRYDGNVFQPAATLRVPPAYAEFLHERGSFRRTPGVPIDRLVQTEEVVHITDDAAEQYPGPAGKYGGARSLIAVPMRKEKEVIGAFVIYRTEVRPFTHKQIELVKSFANQAVIAIENVRLLNELRESLQQQTATADVLKVISRSALDLQRVLDALVESAARLTDANDAAVFQVFGDSLLLVAHHGQIPMAGPVGRHTLPRVRGHFTGRIVIDRRTIQVADMHTEADEYPESRKIALRLGYRTALGVPLIHASEAIGVILVRRTEVRPFTERQIELVNTFADQAVIAIENARLFNEIAQKSRDLELASQHKSQFVANMSHELRTPLAAILGYAELMQEGFYGNQSEKSMDALARIRSNGKHLLGLINTVLDIAKIESGQFTLNMAEYAIESVIETVRSATESLAQNKKLALKTDVSKSLPIGLGDEQRLTQVLLNLVGNAIKFTDTGEVRVTAKAVNGHFNVSVTDTGPGIPDQEQTRIFEQFHQVDSSLTKAKGGTGLGLAIAKQIIEMHGGRIWVESTLGKGSTFQIELPTRAEFRKRAP